MEHERAFLEAIAEHPDDLHRLAWADWLDDHGQTDRANFIRAQLRIASLPEEDVARDAAEDEADDLLAEHESEWLGGVAAVAARLHRAHDGVGRHSYQPWQGVVRADASDAC